MVTLDDDVGYQVLSEVEQLVATMLEGSNISYGMTGMPALRAAILRSMQRDQLIFNIAGPMIGVLIAFVLFRRIGAVVILVSGPLLGILWTMGFLAAIGEPLDLFNCIIAPLAFTIGFSDTVHLALQMRRELSAGLGVYDAAAVTLRKLARACTLTSLTTAIGFASLFTAQVGAVARSGLTCAAGVLLTFAAVLTAVPLLSSTALGRQLAPLKHRQHGAELAAPPPQLIRFVLRHPRPVFVLGLATTIAALIFSFQLRPTIRLSDHLPEESQERATLRKCDRLFGGTLPVYALIEWAPETIPRAEELVDILRQTQHAFAEHSNLSRPRSLLNLLESLPGETWSDKFRELKHVPKQRLRRLIRSDRRQAVVITYAADLGSQLNGATWLELEQRFAEIQAAHPDFEIRLTGTAVVHAQVAPTIVDDLTKSLRQAALVIFVVIAIALKSFRLGLFSLIPNLLPLVFTAGLMVAFNLPLHFTTATVFCVCLGIAVDDTIHFLVRFRREELTQGDLQTAIFRTYSKVGSALVVTTIVLSAGFAVVGLSGIPSIRLFAALLIFGMVSALLADLVFLPSQLASCSTHHSRAESQDVVSYNASQAKSELAP